MILLREAGVGETLQLLMLPQYDKVGSVIHESRTSVILEWNFSIVILEGTPTVIPNLIGDPDSFLFV